MAVISVPVRTAAATVQALPAVPHRGDCLSTKWVDTTSAQVEKYVADVLRQHYTRYNDYMSKEADMRRELQRYVTTLEVGSLKASL